MMHEWALMRCGRIHNVVTTHCTKSEVEQANPGYVVRDFYSLPASVQEEYRYWNERP